MEPLTNSLIFTKITSKSPQPNIPTKRRKPIRGQNLKTSGSNQVDSYYAVKDALPAAVRHTLIKGLRRRLFLKLKRLVLTLSMKINMDLLRKIDPKLYGVAKDKTQGFKIVFRLYGENWPPLIVYRTAISSVKDVRLEANTAAAVSEWKAMFSNEPVILRRPQEKRYTRTSKRIQLENLYSHRRNANSTTPNKQLSSGKVQHKPFEITYNWKTLRRMEYEARPAYKWRNTPSQFEGSNTFDVNRKSPRVLPTPLALFRSRFKADEYRARWNSFGAARLARASPTQRESIGY
jgi:hypothetical protein